MKSTHTHTHNYKPDSAPSVLSKSFELSQPNNMKEKERKWLEEWSLAGGKSGKDHLNLYLCIAYGYKIAEVWVDLGVKDAKKEESKQARQVGRVRKW